jgi:hypothetical protein
VLAGEQQDLPEEEENYKEQKMAKILEDIFKRINENGTCNNGAESLARGRTSFKKTLVVKRGKVVK